MDNGKSSALQRQGDATDLVVMCMYCQRTMCQVSGCNRWELVPEHLARLPPNVSHGICPDCYEEQYRNLRPA